MNNVEVQGSFGVQVTFLTMSDVVNGRLATPQDEIEDAWGPQRGAIHVQSFLSCQTHLDMEQTCGPTFLIHL